MHEQWQALVPLMESGIIKPPIGATYGFEHFGRALVDMEQRRTLGKSVVRVHD
jgi:NADPH2:quinone reductase